ncbi:MAG: O-antigen ligase family protein, partial [Syntrophorhabdales bacterium]
FIVRVTVFVRGRSGFADVDTLAFIQVLIVFLNCFLSLISRRVFRVIGDILKFSLLFLFLYYVLCMLSSIWSSLPQFTLYKSFEYAALLLSVLIAISFEKNYESAEKKVLLLVTITLFCGIFLGIKVHHYQVSVESLHTNQYSATAAMLCAYCFGEYFKAHKPRKKRLRRFGMVGFLFLVIGTSAASNMAFLCGAILVFLLVGRLLFAFAAAWMLVISALIGVYVFGTNFGFLAHILAPGKTAKELETASDRTMIVEYYKNKIFESPFIGYGFAVMEMKKGLVQKGETHNSILSILLGTGLVGMFFYGVFLIKLGMQSVKSLAAKREGCIGATAAVLTGLINSLAIPLVGDYWMEPSFTFSCFLSLSIWHILARDRKGKRYVPTNFNMNHGSAKI